MKKRNPFFVAGFPYILIFLGYIGIYSLVFSTPSDPSGENISAGVLLAMFVGFILVIIASIYTLYWQVSTARALRKATDAEIPNAILLIIPFANIWWQYKYSEAAEKYTYGKIQAVLGFILLFLLGAIGMAILQDYYNKVGASQAGSIPEPAYPTQQANQAPPTNPDPPTDQNPPAAA